MKEERRKKTEKKKNLIEIRSKYTLEKKKKLIVNIVCLKLEDHVYLYGMKSGKVNSFHYRFNVQIRFCVIS